MSDSLWPHGLQHTRLLCPPLSPGVCWNSCSLSPLSQWCYLTILSSALFFSFCLQSFPASESFPVSRFFISGGQSIGASASVLPVNIQGWFPLGGEDNYFAILLCCPTFHTFVFDLLLVDALVIYMLVKMCYNSSVTSVMFINNIPLYFISRKIRGSLKICSKSVIFEPDAISQPIIKVNTLSMWREIALYLCTFYLVLFL